MTIEASLTTLLGPLVAGRVYPDVTPDGAVFPLIIYQQVGGDAYAYADQSMPDQMHARIQIWVWSQRRLEASTIGRTIERTILASGMTAQAYGALVGDYQQELKLYGTRQDFGLWFSAS